MSAKVESENESGKKIIKPVSATLKNLKEKINAIFQEKKFEVREGQSALKNFAREYIVDGRAGYDPQRFFEAVRNLLIKILQENKNTKTKVILNCKMQRTDLKTGEIIEVDAEFHSEIEINLEKDENKLLDKMFARIGEILANFQRSGSNWFFKESISWKFTWLIGNRLVDLLTFLFHQKSKIRGRL